MKKQEKQLVRVQVQQVDMLKHEKSGKVAGWICSCIILWLLLLTSVLFFIDIFPLQKVMEWIKLLGGLFAIAIWVTITYTHKKTMIVMLPLTWILMGVFIVRRWEWLWLCIQNLVDAVIIQVNQYHWTRYALWNSVRVPSAEIMLACMVPISLWSGYYVVRKPAAGLALLPAILIGVGGLYVGGFAGWGAAGLFVLLFFALRCIRASEAKGVGLFYSGAIGVMAVWIFFMVLVIVLLFVKGSLEKHQSTLIAKQEEFIEKIRSGELFEDNIVEEVVSNFRRETDSLSNSGPVFTGRKVLKVTVEEKPSEMLYLRGFVGETYDNNQWDSIDEKAFEENWQESDGITLQNMTYELLGQGNKPTWVTIDGIGLRENYAYAPYYVGYTSEFEAYGDGSVSKAPTDPYTYYGFPFMDVTKVELPTQGRWAYLEREYQKYVRQVYLKLPDELSELKLECRATGLYGQEDLTQIHYYIKDRLRLFGYSQQLDPLPEGEDYINYFLYRQQKGYCEHFASATVAMYRAMGIPARYVTGYAVPPDAFDDNGYAEALDYMGHAWAEIYVDGIGWVRVDYTPSVDANPLYGGLQEEDESSVQESSWEESSREESFKEENSRDESSREESSRGDGLGTANDSKEESSTSSIALFPGGNHGNGGTLVDWAGIFEKIAQIVIILLIPTILVMLVCLRRLLVLSARMHPKEQTDYRPQIRRLGRQIFALLRFSHYPKNSHNLTDEGYSDQLMRELRLPVVKKILDLLEEATYGGLAMTEEDYFKLLNYFNSLVDTLWREWNFVKHFWAKWGRCWK